MPQAIMVWDCGKRRNKIQELHSCLVKARNIFPKLQLDFGFVLNQICEDYGATLHIIFRKA